MAGGASAPSMTSRLVLFCSGLALGALVALSFVGNEADVELRSAGAPLSHTYTHTHIPRTLRPKASLNSCKKFAEISRQRSHAYVALTAHRHQQHAAHNFCESLTSPRSRYGKKRALGQLNNNLYPHAHAYNTTGCLVGSGHTDRFFDRCEGATQVPCGLGWLQWSTTTDALITDLGQVVGA
jgi:hypothetical protein